MADQGPRGDDAVAGWPQVIPVELTEHEIMEIQHALTNDRLKRKLRACQIEAFAKSLQ